MQKVCYLVASEISGMAWQSNNVDRDLIACCWSHGHYGHMDTGHCGDNQISAQLCHYCATVKFEQLSAAPQLQPLLSTNNISMQGAC